MTLSLIPSPKDREEEKPREGGGEGVYGTDSRSVASLRPGRPRDFQFARKVVSGSGCGHRETERSKRGPAPREAGISWEAGIERACGPLKGEQRRREPEGPAPPLVTQHHG